METYVDEEKHAVESTPELEEYDRENRFIGSDRKWLLHTKHERAIIDHLYEEQANDLSLHLYNAHALKALQYNPDRRNGSWEAKRLWNARQDGFEAWVPSQFWTAWPMRYTLVPRLNERHGNLANMREEDPDVLKRAETWYPTLDLEDELLAMFLRKAKDQLEARPRSEKLKIKLPPNHDSEQNDMKATMQEMVTEPSVTLDDEAAKELLLPDIRRILSQFDKLLSALHTSRLAQRVAFQGVSGRKRKHVQVDDEASSLHDTATGGDAEYLTKEIQKNTRDWSEVLGLAAMAGWDEATLKASSKRCSSLFRESMDYSTKKHTWTATPSEYTTLYPCPVADCSRAKDFFREKGMCAFHLKKVHHLQDQEHVAELVDSHSVVVADASTKQTSKTKIYLEEAMRELG